MQGSEGNIMNEPTQKLAASFLFSSRGALIGHSTRSSGYFDQRICISFPLLDGPLFTDWTTIKLDYLLKRGARGYQMENQNLFPSVTKVMSCASVQAWPFFFFSHVGWLFWYEVKKMKLLILQVLFCLVMWPLLVLTNDKYAFCTAFLGGVTHPGSVAI